MERELAGTGPEDLGMPPGATPSDIVREGLFSLYHEDEEDAIEYFNAAIRLDPSDLRAHYLAALCAHLLSQEDTLENVCAHALQVNRRHPFTLACEAVRFLFLANFSRAETLFERALGGLPDALELQMGVGILHEYSGDKTKGIEAFTRALELDPENIRAHVSLGGFYAMDGEFDSAMTHYRQAKEIDPSAENPHQKLGRDYYYESMFEQAASEFSHAMDEEPDEPAAYFYLLDSLRRLGRADDSLDVYEDIRNRFGNDPELTSGFYEHFNMQREAISALEKLAARKPREQGTLLRLSQAYKAADRLDDAVSVAERLTRVAPNDFAGFALLGELYFKRGEYDMVVTMCRRATALNKDAHSAYTTMADALLFLGRQEESHDTVRELERVRKEAWESYQAKFSGQDRADADFE